MFNKWITVVILIGRCEWNDCQFEWWTGKSLCVSSTLRYPAEQKENPAVDEWSCGNEEEVDS